MGVTPGFCPEPLSTQFPRNSLPDSCPCAKPSPHDPNESRMVSTNSSWAIAHEARRALMRPRRRCAACFRNIILLNVAFGSPNSGRWAVRQTSNQRTALAFLPKWPGQYGDTWWGLYRFHRFSKAAPTRRVPGPRSTPVSSRALAA
jgi:hypothetical protein